MNDELTALAEQVRALAPDRGPGKRFSAEAREICVEAVEVGRRSGIGVAEVSRRLGVSVGSLQRWTGAKPRRRDRAGQPGRLHEVVVRKTAPAPAVGLTVRSRDGLEVTGVDVVQLAAVVQVLRT